MAKQWKDLQPAEKIEDLRRDIERIFRLLTEISEKMGALAALQRGTDTMTKEVAKAVEKIEQRLDRVKKPARKR